MSVSSTLLGRALSARERPAPDGLLVIDVDSFVVEVCGRLKQGVAYGYTSSMLSAPSTIANSSAITLRPRWPAPGRSRRKRTRSPANRLDPKS